MLVDVVAIQQTIIIIRMINKIKYLIILFLFCSCEKEIELQLDEGQDKLVVNSFFYPDTNFRVYVSSTKLITDNNSSYINDAEVKLFENENYVETLNFESNGWYTSISVPNYKNNYKIEVKQGGRFVYASSYVPDSTVFFGEYSRLRTCNTQFVFSQTDYKLSIIDNINEEKYYQTMEGFYFQIQEEYNYISDPIVLADSEISYNPRSIFFSNTLFQSDTTHVVISKGSVSNATPFTNCDNNIIYQDFKIPTKTLSKEYYLFLKTWVKHRFNQNSDVNLEDPFSLMFQGEPIEMYSNVVGGYGVFAGFNKTEVEFIFIP